MSGPYTDPQDARFLNPEWDTLFGFMIGRLLHAGYTPAQIQTKCRFTADLIRGITRSPEGQQVGQVLTEGYEDAVRLAEEKLDELDKKQGPNPS